MRAGRSPSLSTWRDSQPLPPHMQFTAEVPKMQEGPLKPHSKPSCLGFSFYPAVWLHSLEP